MAPEAAAEAEELYGPPEEGAQALSMYTDEQLEFLIGFPIASGRLPGRADASARRRRASARGGLKEMRVAALLRGINIGSKARISMPAPARSSSPPPRRGDVSAERQRRLHARARGGRKDLGRKLESAITKETGLDVRVLVRTGRELAGVVSANLYPVDDLTRVVVAFLGKAVTPARLGLGELDAYALTN